MTEEENIANLERAKVKMDAEIRRMKKTIAAKKFDGMAIQEIAEKWDKSEPSDRIDMICEIPEFQEELDRGESYGGLTRGEIEAEVLESEWDDDGTAEIDKSEIFEEYCKK